MFNEDGFSAELHPGRPRPCFSVSNPEMDDGAARMAAGQARVFTRASAPNRGPGSLQAIRYLMAGSVSCSSTCGLLGVPFIFFMFYLLHIIPPSPAVLFTPLVICNFARRRLILRTLTRYPISCVTLVSLGFLPVFFPRAALCAELINDFEHMRAAGRACVRTNQSACLSDLSDWLIVIPAVQFFRVRKT